MSDSSSSSNKLSVSVSMHGKLATLLAASIVMHSVDPDREMLDCQD